MFTFWKEMRNGEFYRFQTDETKIHQIMKKNKRFNLTGVGVNCKLWIYRINMLSSQRAQVLFKDIQGKAKKKKRTSAKSKK